MVGRWNLQTCGVPVTNALAVSAVMMIVVHALAGLSWIVSLQRVNGASSIFECRYSFLSHLVAHWCPMCSWNWWIHLSTACATCVLERAAGFHIQVSMCWLDTFSAGYRSHVDLMTHDNWCRPLLKQCFNPFGIYGKNTVQCNVNFFGVRNRPMGKDMDVPIGQAG